MSDERILEVVERQDKYYILGFINGLKANRDELLRENEELKKQLANNGIVSTCENCEWFEICPHSYREFDYKNECEKLKKQLEVGEEQYNDLVEEKEKLEEQLSSLTLEQDYTVIPNCDIKPLIDKYKTQQQEFINYISAYIELLNDKPDLVEESQIHILEEILQKYKEIIGGNKDE